MFDQVRINYDEMAQTKGRFIANAGEIEEMLWMVQRAYEVLRSGAWVGNAANSFFDEMDNSIIPSVRRLNEALVQGGILSEQVATTFRTGEEEAAGGFTRAKTDSPLPQLLGNSNSMRVPNKWLDGVKSALADGLKKSAAERFIPKDWLSNVEKMLGKTLQPSTMNNEMGGSLPLTPSGSGGSSGGGSGAGKGATSPTSPAMSTPKSGGGGGSPSSMSGGKSPLSRGYDWPRGNTPNGYVAAGSGVSAHGSLPHASIHSSVSTPGNSQTAASRTAPIALGSNFAGGSFAANQNQILPDLSALKIVMAVASPFAVLAINEVKKKFDNQ